MRYPLAAAEETTMKRTATMSLVIVLVLLFPSVSLGAAFTFSTGSPDGRMATASRPATAGKIEIESADDFIISGCATSITSASFFGLITGGVPLSSITQVVVEMYRVFPLDSDTVRTPQVPTRANSPSDVALDVRDSGAGGLTFTVSTVAATFTAGNSVLNGIHPIPTQTTNGEGAVTGQEVMITVNFPTPFVLPPNHYFFVPQVAVTGGEFYWLSAPKPIVAAPFNPDLQSWIRNAPLAPDWLRVGTDIVGGATPPTFNAAFSLTGSTVPIVITPTSASPLNGVEGAPISSTTFTATGGVAPFAFSEAGALPAGVTLTSAGVLSGTPAEEGSFPITVMVTDAAGCTDTLAYTIHVADAALTLTMTSFTFTAGSPFTGAVAAFHDANTASPASDFTATINWGDGATSAGTIISTGGGNFSVSGTHTFASAGPFNVTVVVNDVGGSTASGTQAVSGTAAVPALSPWMLGLLLIALAAIALQSIAK
ncbi:MAG TPA: putative Ig domain-containing protein [Thermoanaerobaculia bacterium]